MNVRSLLESALSSSWPLPLEVDACQGIFTQLTATYLLGPAESEWYDLFQSLMTTNKSPNRNQAFFGTQKLLEIPLTCVDRDTHAISSYKQDPLVLDVRYAACVSFTRVDLAIPMLATRVLVGLHDNATWRSVIRSILKRDTTGWASNTTFNAPPSDQGDYHTVVALTKPTTLPGTCVVPQVEDRLLVWEGFRCRGNAQVESEVDEATEGYSGCLIGLIRPASEGPTHTDGVQGCSC